MREALESVLCSVGCYSVTRVQGCFSHMSLVLSGRSYGDLHCEELFQKLLGPPNCILIELFSLFQEALGSPLVLVGPLGRREEADWLLEVSGPEDTPLDLWISGSPSDPGGRAEGRLPSQSTTVWQSHPLKVRKPKELSSA